MWSVVRGLFYVWFSIAAGLASAFAIFFALSRTPGPTFALPAGGWPLLITPPALILASLVLTQLSHFGQRISLLRWIALCVVATVLTFAAAAFRSGL